MRIKIRRLADGSLVIKVGTKKFDYANLFYYSNGTLDLFNYRVIGN